MKVSRRSAASLLAALPLVGRSAASNLAQGSSIGASAGKMIGAGSLQQAGCAQPDGPRLPHWRAAQLALADPDLRALARSIAYSRHRVITAIDPDIEVHKSISPMAKITFQRQRNVERDIAEICSEGDHERAGPIQQLIQRFMWGSNS